MTPTFFHYQGNYKKGIFRNNLMAKIIRNHIVSNEVMENSFESVKSLNVGYRTQNSLIELKLYHFFQSVDFTSIMCAS